MQAFIAILDEIAKIEEVVNRNEDFTAIIDLLCISIKSIPDVMIIRSRSRSIRKRLASAGLSSPYFQLIQSIYLIFPGQMKQ